MEDLTWMIEIPMDYSEGECGDPHPEIPGIACRFPAKEPQGETMHIMFGGHCGGPNGESYLWPRRT